MPSSGPCGQSPGLPATPPLPLWAVARRPVPASLDHRSTTQRHSGVPSLARPQVRHVRDPLLLAARDNTHPRTAKCPNLDRYRVPAIRPRRQLSMVCTTDGH